MVVKETHMLGLWTSLVHKHADSRLYCGAIQTWDLGATFVWLQVQDGSAIGHCVRAVWGPRIWAPGGHSLQWHFD